MFFFENVFNRCKEFYELSSATRDMIFVSISRSVHTDLI